MQAALDNRHPQPDAVLCLRDIGKAYGPVQVLSQINVDIRPGEVLALLVEGKLNKQIADQLGIVEKTIKVHRARVLAKMKVRSSTALVRLVDRVQRAAGDRT